ncbi:MAG: type II toxin-antitoxin system ParD family antitoxin [Candidatus Hydrogenedentes bacterium]|nr:type II toxin-antitoxin system ParD family antitoxin [Candidatus Hydrogenedentota bacterium]
MEIPVAIEPLINEQLASGRYESIEILLHDALTILKDQQDDDLEELRAMLQEGLDEIERGETLPAEEVFAELRALQASYRNNHSA